MPKKASSTLCSTVTLQHSLMAEFGKKRAIDGGLDEDDDDYMGDLSMFLPPELTNPPKPLPKKVANGNDKAGHSTKNKLRRLNWQELRTVNRKERQLEEDQQTLAKIEEAPIGESNIGFKLLKQMGYEPGTGLGKEGEGRAEPVGLEIRRSRGGIGLEEARKEKQRRDMAAEEMKRRNEHFLAEDFGVRQKSQWRSRRVAVHFAKAKAALDQLENREVEVNDHEEDEVEEEEEEITEEDLLDILMKLREEHRYCLFCGCQYESAEALISNCPGTDEDDH